MNSCLIFLLNNVDTNIKLSNIYITEIQCIIFHQHQHTNFVHFHSSVKCIWFITDESFICLEMREAYKISNLFTKLNSSDNYFVREKVTQDFDAC